MWQQNRNRFTLGSGVLALLVLTGTVRAAPEPLDELEKILLEKRTPKRAQQLTEQIGKLRISDLRRALAFRWQKEDDVWRREVGKKLADDLTLAARHKDRNVRLAVANLIAEMGPKKVPALDAKDAGGFARSLAPIVVALVGDPDMEVSWEALRALGTINANPALAVPEFRKVLTTDTGSAASHRLAADGLKRLLLVATHLHKASQARTEDVGATRKELMDVARQVVSAVGSVSAAGARTGLYDPDFEVRVLLLEALEASSAAFSGDFGSLSDITDTKRIKGYYERVTEINGLLQDLAELVQRRTKGKEEALFTTALQDPDVRVQRAAIDALEELGRLRTRLLKHVASLASLPPLEGEPIPKVEPKFNQSIEGMVDKAAVLLRSPDLSVRRSAMHFLEDLEDRAEPALDYLIERLDDPDRFMRWAAARALSNMPAEKAAKAVPALKRVLSYPDVDVRLAAVAALVRLEQLAKDAVPELEKGILQPHRDPEYRIAVMKALISIGPANCLTAIPSLVKALKDGDVRVRQTAAEILGKFGPLARQAIPALREALGDDDTEVRENASLAILNILNTKK